MFYGHNLLGFFYVAMVLNLSISLSNFILFSLVRQCTTAHKMVSSCGYVLLSMTKHYERNKIAGFL